MRKKSISYIVAALLGAVTFPALAQGLLAGDARTACEAILCLSSGQRPDQCTPPLQRYFSISYRRITDTLRGRMDFLKLCPAASQDANMNALVNDIANGAGRCDAASLNSSSTVMQGNSDGGYTFYVGNVMPGYCSSYLQNAYTNLKNTMAMYVGVPERGGFWVAPGEFTAAQAAYNATIAAQDEAAAQAALLNNYGS